MRLSYLRNRDEEVVRMLVYRRERLQEDVAVRSDPQRARRVVLLEIHLLAEVACAELVRALRVRDTVQALVGRLRH